MAILKAFQIHFFPVSFERTPKLSGDILVLKHLKIVSNMSSSKHLELRGNTSITGLDSTDSVLPTSNDFLVLYEDAIRSVQSKDLPVEGNAFSLHREKCKNVFLNGNLICDKNIK